jgi:hypothetical protein
MELVPLFRHPWFYLAAVSVLLSLIIIAGGLLFHFANRADRPSKSIVIHLTMVSGRWFTLSGGGLAILAIVNLVLVEFTHAPHPVGLVAAAFTVFALFFFWFMVLGPPAWRAAERKQPKD